MRIALAVALVGLASGCVSQDKLRAQEAEAAKYKAETDQLKAQLSNTKGDLDAERKRAAELQGKYDELAAKQRSLESAKAELERVRGKPLPACAGGRERFEDLEGPEGFVEVLPRNLLRHQHHPIGKQFVQPRLIKRHGIATEQILQFNAAYARH